MIKVSYFADLFIFIKKCLLIFEIMLTFAP